MSALQPLKTSRIKPPHLRCQHRRQRQQPYHRLVAIELSVKLAVNGLLGAIAIFTIIKLLPYQLAQQKQLQEVRVQVQDTERRVTKLKTEFSHNFDPNQTKRVMQEQSPRLAPNQRRIFWQQ